MATNLYCHALWQFLTRRLCLFLVIFESYWKDYVTWTEYYRCVILIAGEVTRTGRLIKALLLFFFPLPSFVSLCFESFKCHRWSLVGQLFLHSHDRLMWDLSVWWGGCSIGLVHRPLLGRTDFPSTSCCQVVSLYPGLQKSLHPSPLTIWTTLYILSLTSGKLLDLSVGHG